MSPRTVKPEGIAKKPMGVAGLDEIMNGGIPTGRATSVCDGPGCGKTVLGMEFLVHSAVQFHEPGVFMAFEETTPELDEKFASMRFRLEDLCAKKKLYIEHARVERSEIEDRGKRSATYRWNFHVSTDRAGPATRVR